MILPFARRILLSIDGMSSQAELESIQAVAESAARNAGKLLRDNFHQDLEVDAKEAYDIKLALDRESQDLITAELLAAFPDHAIVGEEGIAGDQESDYRWIVDPIDGTVNFFYGIPHFCVSIALQMDEESIVGVIYDPILDEMFSVVSGGEATCNGKPIKVSGRDTLGDAIMTVGFSKSKKSLDAGFERYKEIAYLVRKTRLLGSAALAMAYIAAGRLDAYIEEQISIWDIAAGDLLVKAAGGTVHLAPSASADGKLFICASNGKLPLEKYCG